MKNYDPESIVNRNLLKQQQDKPRVTTKLEGETKDKFFGNCAKVGIIERDYASHIIKVHFLIIQEFPELDTLAMGDLRNRLSEIVKINSKHRI